MRIEGIGLWKYQAATGGRRVRKTLWLLEDDTTLEWSVPNESEPGDGAVPGGATSAGAVAGALRTRRTSLRGRSARPRRLELALIRRVELGEPPEVGAHAPSPYFPSQLLANCGTVDRAGRYFSLVLDERTVDFEADSDHDARSLVAVIRAVADGQPDLSHFG